jgi:RNA polymerase sigma-70 factor (ECF subfamily)
MDGVDTTPANADKASALDPSDAELVAATLSGKESAFEALFERHREALYRYAWRYTRDADTAMDLVQEAFVRAYESLGDFRGERGLGPWLRRILSNLAIDRFRRKDSKAVSLDDEGHGEVLLARADTDEGGDAQTTAELKEFGAALQEAVATLSEAHRDVFLLHAVEDLTYKEIAERVGCTLGTVMSRLHYARKNLRELLCEHWDEDHDR